MEDGLAAVGVAVDNGAVPVLGEALLCRHLGGGLVVRVGSRMIDSSIKNKLQRLKVAMKGVG